MYQQPSVDEGTTVQLFGKSERAVGLCAMRAEDSATALQLWQDYNKRPASPLPDVVSDKDQPVCEVDGISR